VSPIDPGNLRPTALAVSNAAPKACDSICDTQYGPSGDDMPWLEEIQVKPFA
jgi:hypothetical protein